MSSWPVVCGASVAARVQLAGCLVLYEVSGFPQVFGIQMLFKTCGTGTGGGGGGGDFEMRRDTAFAALEGVITTSSGGFIATSYQAIYAMAQCEGDLSTGDCSQCVTQAVQHVKVECGGAPSGQVYLDKCYISYSYYPHGVPHSGSAGAAGLFLGVVTRKLILFGCHVNGCRPSYHLETICSCQEPLG